MNNHAGTRFYEFGIVVVLFYPVKLIINYSRARGLAVFIL